MSELKPCPFCGGKAMIDYGFSSSLNASGGFAYVFCEQCRVSGSRHTSEKQAEKAWNTRVERTCKMKKARWDDGQCTWGVICSACCKKHEHSFEYSFNFCPTCGAKVVDDA